MCFSIAFFKGESKDGMVYIGETTEKAYLPVNRTMVPGGFCLFCTVWYRQSSIRL